MHHHNHVNILADWFGTILWTMAEEKTSSSSQKKETGVKLKHSSSKIVQAPIDRWGYIGIWIRHQLLECIKIGVPVNLVLQKHRTPFINKIMTTCSFLGSEDFFTLLAMFITWIIDARLGRLFTILLGLGFYCSSFFKSLLCLPRPPSPPVTPLHREDLDWAFPSHHGIMGVVAPWYLWFYCFIHYHSPPAVQILLFIGFLLWSVGVIFSRIYLGVHSPADMVGGGIMGVTILSIYLLVDDYIDYQCAAGRFVVPQAIVIVLGFLAVHPRTVPETQSFGETVIVTSCAFGCVIARACPLTKTSKLSLWDISPADSTMTEVWLIGILRLVLGISIVLTTRLLTKRFFKSTFFAMYNYFGVPCYSFTTYLQSHPATSKHLNYTYKLPPLTNNEKSSDVSEDENGSSKSDSEEDSDGPTCLPYDVDIPTRFFCYTILGWLLCEGGPLVFHLIGV